MPPDNRRSGVQEHSRSFMAIKCVHNEFDVFDMREVVYIHGAAIYIVTFYIVQSRILNVRDRPRAIINQPPIKIKMRIDRR